MLAFVFLFGFIGIIVLTAFCFPDVSVYQPVYSEFLGTHCTEFEPSQQLFRKKIETVKNR
jgi:hypothetical protein